MGGFFCCKEVLKNMYKTGPDRKTVWVDQPKVIPLKPEVKKLQREMGDETSRRMGGSRLRTSPEPLPQSVQG